MATTKGSKPTVATLAAELHATRQALAAVQQQVCELQAALLAGLGDSKQANAGTQGTVAPAAVQTVAVAQEQAKPPVTVAAPQQGSQWRVTRLHPATGKRMPDTKHYPATEQGHKLSLAYAGTMRNAARQPLVELVA